MAYQGDDNDDFGQNEEQQSASNDYQSIFNPDAEDTEQDYQQYMAKLNMDTPQGGGGGDNSSKKKKSYKKREPPSNNYNEYSDHNNQNDQNDSNNNNNNNTFDDNNYNDNNDNNNYPDYDNDNVENNDEHNDINNDTNNNNNNNNFNNNNNKKHNKAKPATIKYKWQWDGGSYWKDYKFEDSQTIETQYGSKDFMFLQIYGTSYQINFANLQQVNTKTGGKRRLRRVPLNHKDNSKQASGSSRGRGRGRGSGSGRGSGRGGGGRGGYSSYKGGHTGYNNNATGGGGGYNNNNYGNNDRGGYGGNASNNRGRGRGSGRGGGMGRGGYHNKSNNNNNNYGGNYNANNSNYNNNNNNNNHNNNVAPATWQIFLGGSWKDYDSGTCSYIESKFQQKNQMIFECTIRGNKYFINLNDMTQANAYTGKTRQIKRKGNAGSSVGGNGGNYQQQNQKQKQNQNKNQHYNNNAQNNYNNDNDKNRSIFDKGDMKQQYQDNNNDYNNSNSYNNNNNNNNNQFGNNQQQPMNNQRGPGPDNNNNTSFQQNQRPQQQQNQGNFNNNNSNYNPNKGLKDNNSNTNMNNMGYDGNSGYNPNQNKQYNNNDDDNKNNYNTFNNNNNNQNNQQLKGSPHKWQWQDGNGNFLDYDSTTSSQMEQLYQNGSKIYKYKAPHNKQIYTIKFNDLKQYNDQTKQSRDIRRVPMSVPSGGASSGVKMNVNNNSGPTMKWQWHDGKNFIDYDKTKSIAMQKAYKSGQKSFSFKHDKSQTKYVINFNRMKQINLKSQNERDIRQVPLSVKGAKPQKPKPKQQKQTTAEGWPNPDTWKGPKATAKRKVFGDKIMTLYHVTDPKSADLIWKDRKMIRGSKGMFGGGIYFAESAASAQYKAEHHGYLLTCKVFVGKEHVVKDSAAGHFTFQDMQKMGCDSVWAPNGSGSGKSERVVYNFDQVCVFKKTKFAPKGKK